MKNLKKVVSQLVSLTLFASVSSTIYPVSKTAHELTKTVHVKTIQVNDAVKSVNELVKHTQKEIEKTKFAVTHKKKKDIMESLKRVGQLINQVANQQQKALQKASEAVSLSQHATDSIKEIREAAEIATSDGAGGLVEAFKMETAG